MNVNLGDQRITPSVGALPPRGALSLEAFYKQHQDGWVRYAHAQTGSRDAAERIADAMALHMQESWPQFYDHENAARYSWKVLKATVTQWLEDHACQSAFVESAVFDRVPRVVRALAQTRDQFDLLEESIGLYSAICLLPDRQYDTVVLRFVLGYDDSTVASFLGVKVNTVRSNIRHAKTRMAKALGIPYTTDAETEEG